MAATPKRAATVEAALVGQPWTRADRSRAAQAALAEDFAPITDWRASADYRAAVGAQPAARFFLETHRRAGAAGAGGGV